MRASRLFARFRDVQQCVWSSVSACIRRYSCLLQCVHCSVCIAGVFRKRFKPRCTCSHVCRSARVTLSVLCVCTILYGHMCVSYHLYIVTTRVYLYTFTWICASGFIFIYFEYIYVFMHTHGYINIYWNTCIPHIAVSSSVYLARAAAFFSSFLSMELCMYQKVLGLCYITIPSNVLFLFGCRALKLCTYVYMCVHICTYVYM